MTVMRSLYLRLIIFGLIAAALLSALSILLLNQISSSIDSDYKEKLYIQIAKNVDSELSASTQINWQVVGRNIFIAPPNSMGPPPNREMSGPPEPPPGRDMPPPAGVDRRMMRPPGSDAQMWVIDDTGTVISANNPNKLPISLNTKMLPGGEFSIERIQDVLRLKGATYIVKLSGDKHKYLIAYDAFRPRVLNFFGIQTVFVFVIIGIAFLLAAVFTFIYLKTKSQEARKVIQKLAAGDLKARFEIHKFDEFAGLIKDFNHMAQEIEMLVSKIRETESSRKKLLQELGHDLRTPLTSLTTSFETLQSHISKMDERTRDELFKMSTAEIHYLRDLIERLIDVSQFDLPQYKKESEEINLFKLLNDEIKNRQAFNTSLSWSLLADQQDIKIYGDYHLIQRMIKNACDNSAKYAHKNISLKLSVSGDEAVINIQDDGSGFSQQALSFYGKRRDRRLVETSQNGQLSFSLGLGSVIMNTIAQLHGGTVQAQNALNQQNEILGAQIIFKLPLIRSED